MNRLLTSLAAPFVLPGFGRVTASAETAQGAKPNLIILLASDMGCGDSSVYADWIDSLMFLRCPLSPIDFEQET